MPATNGHAAAQAEGGSPRPAGERVPEGRVRGSLARPGRRSYS